MANEKSLANLKSNKKGSPSNEKAVMWGRMGGKKYSENLKKRKAIAELMKDCLYGNMSPQARDVIDGIYGEGAADQLNVVQAMILRMTDKAIIHGDVNALKELTSWVESKPEQKTEITGKDGGPINVVISPTQDFIKKIRDELK